VIAIHEAAGDRYQLLLAHADAAELAASRGDVPRATSHLAIGAELAREVPSSNRSLLLIQSAAYVAYMDGRADDAAVLFGARLRLSTATFAKRYRPILEALEKQGLREEIAAGANLSAEEALERAVEVIRSRPSTPN